MNNNVLQTLYMLANMCTAFYRHSDIYIPCHIIEGMNKNNIHIAPRYGKVIEENILRGNDLKVDLLLHSFSAVLHQAEALSLPH